MKKFLTITGCLLAIIAIAGGLISYIPTSQTQAPEPRQIEVKEVPLITPTQISTTAITPEKVMSTVEAPLPDHDGVSYWLQDVPDGPVTIRISLSRQQAYFFKGENLAGIALVSTGKKGHETPTGRFVIEQKIKDHRSGTYGSYVDKKTGRVVRSNVNRHSTKTPPGSRYVGSKMSYYMKFAPEIGMHSGYLPGYPASHGCVRMPLLMARYFFENCEVGTPVIVEP